MSIPIPVAVTETAAKTAEVTAKTLKTAETAKTIEATEATRSIGSSAERVINGTHGEFGKCIDQPNLNAAQHSSFQSLSERINLKPQNGLEQTYTPNNSLERRVSIGTGQIIDIPNIDAAQHSSVEALMDRAKEKQENIHMQQQPEIVEEHELNDSYSHIAEDRSISKNLEIARADILPRNGGSWEGEAGNSPWNPNDTEIPGNRHGTNPDGKSWREVKDQYGFESIEFKDSEPDFSEVSKGTVEIDGFSDDRSQNFAKADEKLAEQKGCTPEEVEKWREDNKYTWHECADCKTMQKVPTEVHGNIPHSGGISAYKSEN